MNTLVISYQYPLPEIGGNRIRTMNFVRYFRQFGDVDIVSFQERAETACDESVFRQAFHIDISGRDQGRSSIRDLYERFRYSKPWIVCAFSREAVQELLDLVEQGRYDHIVCRYALSAYPLTFLSPKWRKKVIVDIDDLMTPGLYESTHGMLPGINRIKSLIDMRLYRQYQINCAKIGTALVCSDHDNVLLLKAAPSADIHTVPNISPEIALPCTYSLDSHDRLGTFLFVGNLAYLPNVQGLIWFVEQIFSRLLAENPTVKLIVIGKDPDRRIQSLCRAYAEIELMENPPDVVPYYDQCGAVVVPLLSGGGTRIKILEAGRARRPVISTPVGGYGLSLRDRCEILFMNDYDSFSGQFDWLKDNDNYCSLVNSMEAFVENNYTKQHFESALSKAVGPAGTPYHG